MRDADHLVSEPESEQDLGGAWNKGADAHARSLATRLLGASRALRPFAGLPEAWAASPVNVNLAEISALEEPN